MYFFYYFSKLFQMVKYATAADLFMRSCLCQSIVHRTIFPREIALYFLTSCDTFQPIKLHYPQPKNNNVN